MIAHSVSCGTLIKQQVADETRLGEAVRQYVEQNQRPPNNLVNKILSDRLMQLDASTKGWVLHGYPLTREQAEVQKVKLYPKLRSGYFRLLDNIFIFRTCPTVVLNRTVSTSWIFLMIVW